MEVVKEVEDQWDLLGFQLDVPQSKREEISRYYQSDHWRMAATLDYYVRQSPNLSWKKIAQALQVTKLHEQADAVTTKYVKGMDVNVMTCLILIQAVDGQQLLWSLISISK